MKKLSLVLLVMFVLMICLGCPGLGKTDKEAADNAISTIQEKYPEEVVEIKIFSRQNANSVQKRIFIQ